MRPALSTPETFAATLAGIRQIAVSTAGQALVFVLAVAGMFWAAERSPETAFGALVFYAVVALAVFAHSLFSASMYRRLVPASGKLETAVWKLTLAWILMIVIAAILATAIVLFFSLIGSSLGVVAGEPGQDVTDMTAQMRESGTFYPLFAVFLLALLGVFWFAVRMMLFAVATVARGQVHVFRTWAWTKGYVLPMMVGMIVFVVLPVSVLGYVASVLVSAAPALQTAAITAGVAILVQVPAAWVAHSYAAAVYTRIAPPPSESG
jgi:hypothetical protein